MQRILGFEIRGKNEHQVSEVIQARSHIADLYTIEKDHSKDCSKELNHFYHCIDIKHRLSYNDIIASGGSSIRARHHDIGTKTRPSLADNKSSQHVFLILVEMNFTCI